MSIYAVNGKEPIAAWIPSVDTSGNGTTTLTDLVGSNHGTLTNMDAATDWVADTEAGGVRALDFDGSNDLVIGTAGEHQTVINSNVFSVSLWAYVRSFSSFPVLWTVQTGTTTDSALIECHNNGNILYVKTANNAIGFTGTRAYTLSSPLVVNTWFHVLFVKSAAGDSGDLYVNGVLQTSYTGTLQTAVISASYIVILASYYGAVNLNGRVDDYRLFDAACDGADAAYLSTSRAVGLLATGKKRPRINGSLINSGLCRSSI